MNDLFWRLWKGLNMSGVGCKARREVLNRLVMEPELGAMEEGKETKGN